MGLHKFQRFGASLAVLFAILSANLSGAPAYAASSTICTGALSSGTYRNIKVPAGATCTLSGVTVLGSINGLVGSSLIMSSSMVNGSVLLSSPATVGIGGPPLTGPIIGNTIRGSMTLTAPSSDVLVSGNTIGGNVSVTGAVGPSLVVGENAPNLIGGSLNVSNNNVPFARITGNTIRGNLRGLSNYIASNSFSNNIVNGSMTYSSNVGSNGIYTNQVTGRLSCYSNSGDPFGGGNTASSKLGQCTSL